MIFRLIGASVLAGSVAACLSIPPEASDGDDIDAGPGDDGGIASCSADGRQGLSFDTASGLIIREMIVADFNGDGCEDFAVSDIDGTDGFGIYVFLSPQPTTGPLEYHAFVETEARPLSFVAAALSGSEELDLVVFGHEADESTGLVEVYEQRPGEASLFAPDAVAKRQTNILPAEGQQEGDYNIPVLVAVGDFDGVGGAFDIAVADTSGLELYFHETGIAELDLESGVSIGANGEVDGASWQSINKLFVVASSGAGDNLLVMQAESISTIPPGNQPGFSTYTPVDGTTMFAGERIDLDGSPPLDIIGGNGEEVAVYTLAGTSPLDIGEVTRSAIDGDDKPLWDVVVLPSKEGTDDLVVIDRGTVSMQGEANVYSDPELEFVDIVGVNDGNLVANLNETTALSGIDPVAGAGGDFDLDGDAELRLIGRNGITQCFVRDNDLGLARCE